MKFRIITNGTYYRAQVRMFFIFWRDLDHNGYRVSRYLVSDKWMAEGYIRKFVERKQRESAERGEWTAIKDHN